MIIVTGSVLARPETVEELRALSLEHVHRSRAEPGCISHDVHVHAEHPLRFFFFERWHDMDTLRVHFAVPESRALGRSMAKLSAEPPSLHIFDATPVTP